ncbi:MAG: [FeFe] hydrogenase H-cluster radical SAM maturase HydE [Ignavibacteriales bacterium]|nr:MAG: [FeFe] hydrogenase H-cluster radical SAM maturase HydE [Ignavibacteriales bacterium]
MKSSDYSSDDLRSWVDEDSPIPSEDLFETARNVRKQYCGDKIYLRGLIEISNHCSCSCLYCGLRKSNDHLTRYIMSPREIADAARLVAECGIKTVVMQSGESLLISAELIEDSILAIKELGDIAVTLSLGEREFTDYDRWLKAGADRYLLKHETANSHLYRKLHPGAFLEDRIEHLRYLKSSGFQTGTGNIIGIPGQSSDDIVDDILLCEELEADMISISPFMPSGNTPFAKVQPADADLTLRVIAAARIYLRDVHMPATTALGTLMPKGREAGLHAGANVVMPSFTPLKYKTEYLIYDNKICLNEEAKSCITCLDLTLAAAGYHISGERGDSPKLALR